MDLSFVILAIACLMTHLVVILCNGDTPETLQGPTDFCTSEKFEPNCNQDEVILIQSAVYGRMNTGTCFPKEEGNFGCSADVKNVLDSMCSGRQTCSVPTFNNELYATKPCGIGSLGYLSISHRCLKVHKTTTYCANLATQSGETTIADSSGYLSTDSTSRASGNCPVSITVPSGRLIKFTVHNFFKKSGSACYEVAVIKQKDNQKSVHVCQSDPRTKEVMVTSSSQVTVQFSNFQIGESIGTFLLQYEAIGCPQPEIPANAHMIRDGDRAKVVCNNSESSWFIYCKDNKWTELDRRCPQDWGISKMFKTDSGFPYGIFLTSFVGVGIGIFLGGFLLFIAINAFQRHQRRLRQMYEAPPVIPDPDYKIYDTSKMDFTLVPGFATGRHTIPRHQMSPPPIPTQPPEDERRFSRHTYEKPKYNSTDNQPYAEA